MAAATLPALLTAEEFGQRPEPGYPEELVKGRIVPLPVPDRRQARDELALPGIREGFHVPVARVFE